MDIQTWVNQTFESRFQQVVVYTDTQGNDTTADPTWLANTIGSTPVPPTYAELTALAITSQGWQKVFDQWKQKGIVS